MSRYDIYMPYWPSVRSRWLDSGRILFFPLQWIETKSRSLKTGKRTRPLSSLLDRPSLVNKVFTIKKNNFGLLRIKNNLFISRAWKESHCVCSARNPQESFIFLWFNCTVFCLFLRLHRRHFPKIRNLISLLRVTLFLARDQSGQSRTGKTGPPFPLG